MEMEKEKEKETKGTAHTDESQKRPTDRMAPKGQSQTELSRSMQLTWTRRQNGKSMSSALAGKGHFRAEPLHNLGRV